MDTTDLDPASLDAAAALIHKARALLVCAGAGMGVDSGLPDFRGDQGFWKAYPPYAHLGLSFVDIADPRHFHSEPELAWGFYGHRLGLYRATTPHRGFEILRRWGEAMPHGIHVLTSNVDGQFQQAGFKHVAEVHGSIHHLQCIAPCSHAIWPATGVKVTVDESTMRARGPLPHCRCGRMARPNILMFGDACWIGDRTAGQERELMQWLAEVAAEGSALAVIELGAGTAVPTVRIRAERIAASRHPGGGLIRINRTPQDALVPAGGISVQAGALAALTAIDERLR